LKPVRARRGKSGRELQRGGMKRVRGEHKRRGWVGV